MPFNSITAGQYASKNGENLYDALQNPLPDDDPRKYERLHLIRNPNHYFGLELEASFVQTPSGLDAWGHDIIFEFTGDDDFWLYVDGELVINLGGVHSALPGKVNYRTGEVEVNGKQTSLYEIFRENYATRNGYAQNDPEVMQYLEGIFEQNGDGQYVFKDYSNHTMKIFFMERGGGASNLHMRFNLTAVKRDQVLLHKKISGTDQVDYKLAEYPYQVFYRTSEQPEGEYLQLAQSNTGSTYAVTHQNSNTPVEYLDSYTLPGTDLTYEGVFFLNAGETAAISLPEDTENYYIVECGVNSEIYDKVLVNDDEVAGRDTEDDERSDYVSSAASIDSRRRVVFDNHVNENAIRTLTITKKLYEVDGETPITDDSAGFTFRLYLGDENDTELLPTYAREYHVKDSSEHYCAWDAINQCFYSLQKSSFEDLTPAEKTAATFNTSTNGTIDKIPADHHVEVRGLLVGTQFRVVEVQPPAGYALLGYEREGSTYIVDEGETVNEGTIRANESPAVLVKNKRGFGLTAKKEWSDTSFMKFHGDIYFAVYVDGQLLEGTVRRLQHPGTSVYYYFDELADGKELSDYAIKEVVLTGDSIEVSDDGVVTGYASITPIENGGKLHVEAVPKEEVVGGSEGSPQEGDEQNPEEYEYTVTYATGTPTGSAQNARTDTVTNSRHGVQLIKQKWNGQPLAGATFTLADAQGNPVGAGQYTSASDGKITIAYVNTDTEYTLTEISTPKGWHALEQPLKFMVTHNPEDGTLTQVTVTQGDSDWYTLAQETVDDMASITVRNRGSRFSARRPRLRFLST